MSDYLIPKNQHTKHMQKNVENCRKCADLEAQTAQLTASLEEASSAVIVLKQQQRERWAQLASGQEPHCYTYIEDGEEYFAPSDGYRPDDAVALYTHPVPAQQPVPLSDVQIFKAYTQGTGMQLPNVGRARGDLLLIARAIEAAYGIKEKP